MTAVGYISLAPGGIADPGTDKRCYRGLICRGPPPLYMTDNLFQKVVSPGFPGLSLECLRPPRREMPRLRLPLDLTALRFPDRPVDRSGTLGGLGGRFKTGRANHALILCSVHSGARGAPNFPGPREKSPHRTAPRGGGSFFFHPAPFPVRCPAFPGPRFSSPPPIPRSGSPVFAGHRLGPRFREVISPRECEFPAFLQC